MFNKFRGEECEWNEHDKLDYCENIGDCPKEDDKIKEVFKQTCHEIKNTTEGGMNECSPLLFRCHPKLPVDENELEVIDNEKNSTDEEFFKCYCDTIIMGNFYRKRCLIDCRCDGYDLTYKEDKKIDKVDKKYKRVNARTCVMLKKQKEEDETQYTCFVNKGCIASCFDSQFQCNTSLYLPDLNPQNNYSYPLISTDQQICYGWGLQRFAGQLSFILLYVPIIFLISYILQHCLELRRTKLSIDPPKWKVPETLKKHVNKVKELCKKKEEQQEVTVEKI